MKKSLLYLMLFITTSVFSQTDKLATKTYWRGSLLKLYNYQSCSNNLLDSATFDLSSSSGGGTTYTAGTGIAINSGVISSTVTGGNTLWGIGSNNDVTYTASNQYKVGIGTYLPQYMLDVDSRNTTTQPLRIKGLLEGTSGDSLLSIINGVVKRNSFLNMYNNNVDTSRMIYRTPFGTGYNYPEGIVNMWNTTPGGMWYFRAEGIDLAATNLQNASLRHSLGGAVTIEKNNGVKFRFGAPTVATTSTTPTTYTSTADQYFYSGNNIPQAYPLISATNSNLFFKANSGSVYIGKSGEWNKLQDSSDVAITRNRIRIRNPDPTNSGTIEINHNLSTKRVELWSLEGDEEAYVTLNINLPLPSADAEYEVLSNCANSVGTLNFIAPTGTSIISGGTTTSWGVWGSIPSNAGGNVEGSIRIKYLADTKTTGRWMIIR